MLKMVKTMAKTLVKMMGKAMTGIDLMIARFDYIYINFIDYITIYFIIIIYTIQFSTNIIIHALYTNTQYISQYMYG